MVGLRIHIIRDVLLPVTQEVVSPSGLNMLKDLVPGGVHQCSPSCHQYFKCYYTLFTFFQIKVFWKRLAWPNPKERKEFAEEIIYVSVMCTVRTYMLEKVFEICEILSV